jgi:hypothetical protein
MSDPTLGGFLPRFEPIVEAEEAAQSRWLRRFPSAGSADFDQSARLAELAGADVAALTDGETVDAFVRRRFPGGLR